MNAAVRVAVRAGNRLGEGVGWCGRDEALYWTDIEAATLWRFTPGDGRVRTWTLPERLASLALCRAEGWLLLALASRLAFFHPASGEMRALHPIEPGLPTRANDGACDRQGRFVFGTLHEPRDGGPARAIGGFYRLNTDLGLESLPLPKAAIANSIAFSPDGTRLYFCDSLQKCIHCCDYGERLGAPSRFVDLSALDGEPDGSTVDAEGSLWNAQWGAGRVVRYAPDGREQARIALPARHPTRPAFAGEALDSLYITSARDGVAHVDDSGGGDVFSCVPGVRGLPEPRFGGGPDVVPASPLPTGA